MSKPKYVYMTTQELHDLTDEQREFGIRSEPDPPEPPRLLFTGETARPSTEARRYVYRILVSMLLAELDDPEGWMFGGVEMEADKRRLRAAIRKVADELKRKVP